MKAEIYVDVADPALAGFVQAASANMHAAVKTGSLHAGTHAATRPALHFRAPDVPFHQAAPTFTEDIVIPWEGQAAASTPCGAAAAKIAAGQDVKLVARVSEGPEERRKLHGRNCRTSSAKRAPTPAVSRRSAVRLQAGL